MFFQVKTVILLLMFSGLFVWKLLRDEGLLVVWMH